MRAILIDSLPTFYTIEVQLFSRGNREGMNLSREYCFPYKHKENRNRLTGAADFLFVLRGTSERLSSNGTLVLFQLHRSTKALSTRAFCFYGRNGCFA